MRKPIGPIPDPAELIEAMPAALICTDADDDYTLRFANRHAANLLGYELEDFLHGKKYSAASVVHPDDLDLLAEGDELHRQGSDRLILRYRLIASDGAEVPVLDVSSRRVDAQGELQGFTSLLIDLRETPALQGPSAILTKLP
ncbi:MAG: PAS domain S-box protein [Planctomycetes bacterium]|nr:PAS domain S-box protein [Planctomycetota bacterium]MCB9934342.1 PAS domain S-box protein [Planctomycetota bacterium]